MKISKLHLNVTSQTIPVTIIVQMGTCMVRNMVYMVYIYCDTDIYIIKKINILYL
jgi:hypothetical protein